MRGDQHSDADRANTNAPLSSNISNVLISYTHLVQHVGAALDDFVRLQKHEFEPPSGDHVAPDETNPEDLGGGTYMSLLL